MAIKNNFNYISAGQGQPILFLHGFPDYSYSWHHQINEFSKTNHVIAPDLLGYNLSAKPMGIDCYTLRSLANRMINFIKDLDLTKIIIVGHDWGGMLAWTLVSYYPEYFEKVMIINAPHPVVFQKLLCASEEQQKAKELAPAFVVLGFKQHLTFNDPKIQQLVDDAAKELKLVKNHE